MAKTGIFTTLLYILGLIVNILTATRGCSLKDQAGNDIDLTDQSSITIGDKYVSDSESREEPLYVYTTSEIDTITAREQEYLDFLFDGNTLTVTITKEYDDWKTIEGEQFNRLKIILDVKCSSAPSTVKVVEIGAGIKSFTNQYPPQFAKDSYQIKLPMPLSNGYTIAGGCGETIEVTDYDYSQYNYKSSVKFEIQEGSTGIEANLIADSVGGKKFYAELKTTQTLNLEKDLTFTLVATDIAPDGGTADSKPSTVTITIIPDILGSTPASPIFSQPFYAITIPSGNDMISPVTVNFEEGYTGTTVTFEHQVGENLEEYFTANYLENSITIQQTKTLPENSFDTNYGILLLRAHRENAVRDGYTVIHISLPESAISTLPPTTSVTCPTEATTVCPECTCPTEGTTTCPTVTCPDCTCPTEGTTTCPTVTCPDCTCPTEGTTTCPTVTCPDCTECPIEGNTTCPTVTCPENTTETDCPTDPASSSCPPCPTTPSITVQFREKEIYKQIYEGSKGYTVAQVIADAPNGEAITYQIRSGGENFKIDQNGYLTIEKEISKDETVTVEARIPEGTDTANVHVHLIPAKVCENGTSEWSHSLQLTEISEGEPASAHILSFTGNCNVHIRYYYPEFAIDYFTVDKEAIYLKKTIDREDPALFHSLSSTEIVLHVDGECGGEEATNTAEQIKVNSAIDAIGNIENREQFTRTRVVIRVLDVNDNSPEYNYKSPAIIGYPDAEISKILQPQHLMKVHATDKDLGETALTYRLETDEFDIDEITGIIYPNPGNFQYKDTSFKVYVNEDNENDEGLQVQVNILNKDNILNMIVEDHNLKDADTVLEEVSLSTGYNVKSLSATLPVTDNDGKKKDSYSILNVLRKRRATDSSDTPRIQLVVYAFDSSNKIVKAGDILSGYKQNTTNDKITFADWDSSAEKQDSNNEDGGSLAAVIALAVVAAVLAVALSGFIVLYIRSRRNGKANSTTNLTDNDYGNEKKAFDGSSAEEEDGFSTPIQGMNIYVTDGQVNDPSTVYETVPEDSQNKTDVIESGPEHSAWTVLGDFKNDAAEEFKCGLSGEEGDITDDEEDANGRKKSVVTFNDNVERIEIEPV